MKKSKKKLRRRRRTARQHKRMPSEGSCEVRLFDRHAHGRGPLCSVYIPSSEAMSLVLRVLEGTTPQDDRDE